MARNTYAEAFTGWRRLIRPLINNNDDHPHLEGHRSRLETLLAQVDEIVARQAALTAEKQEASLELKELTVEGNRVAAFLKTGIRERYGRSSEKLVEYGLQPFRGKKTAKPEEPEEPEEPGEVISPASTSTTRTP